MIIVTASGGIPAMYGEPFVDRRYVAVSFTAMMKYFDAIRDDEWYGVREIRITEIIGASYDDLTNNSDWLSQCGYYFTTITRAD